jgi:polyhydroxybutyrate depolymerase
MKRIILIAWMALVLTACGRLSPNASRSASTLQSGDFPQTIQVGGRERTYDVHLPPNLANVQALALVIALHGGGGDDDNIARMSGMSAKADREHFISVYPNGSGRLGDKLLTWNSGNCCGYALDQKIDDVEFIRALIDKMLATYPIDAKRIFVTGMSNGAMISYRLGCELSDKIAAIAPVSGALNIDCKPSQPLSVIAFHGTGDQHVPYNGGAGTKSIDPHPRTDQSVAYAMTFWSERDGCNATPKRDERGNIVHDTYTNCANKTGVELYTIKGGGHAWPGGVRGSFLGDAPTQDISATDLMWEFFKQHSK